MIITIAQHARRVHFMAVAIVLAACSGPPATTPPPASGLAQAESAYADLRALHDRYEVTTAAGLASAPDGTTLPALAERHDAVRAAVVERLAAVDSASLSPGDARALAVMRATVGRDLAPLGPTRTPAAAAADASPDCAYDPEAVSKTANGLDSLRVRIYACYGWAQHHVVVGKDTLDRLTVLGAIGRTADSMGRAAALPFPRPRLAEHQRRQRNRQCLPATDRPRGEAAWSRRASGGRTGPRLRRPARFARALAARIAGSLAGCHSRLAGRAVELVLHRGRSEPEAESAHSRRAAPAPQCRRLQVPRRRRCRAPHPLRPRSTRGKNSGRLYRFRGTRAPPRQPVGAGRAVGVCHLPGGRPRQSRRAAPRNGTRHPHRGHPDSSGLCRLARQRSLHGGARRLRRARRGGAGVAAALAGRLRAAGRRPSRPVRRHRDGRGLGAARDADAAGARRRPQRSLDRAHARLSPYPPPPGAVVVGDAGAADRRPGLHDELCGGGHTHRGDPRADHRAARLVRRRRFDLVPVGGAPALSLRAGAPHARRGTGLPRRAGVAEGDPRRHGENAKMR